MAPKLCCNSVFFFFFLCVSSLVSSVCGRGGGAGQTTCIPMSEEKVNLATGECLDFVCKVAGNVCFRTAPVQPTSPPGVRRLCLLPCLSVFFLFFFDKHDCCRPPIPTLPFTFIFCSAWLSALRRGAASHYHDEFFVWLLNEKWLSREKPTVFILKALCVRFSSI